MIKLAHHPLACQCEGCATMFPADRFDAVWTAPRPSEGPAERVTGAIPIGDPAAPVRAVLWVDDEDRLLTDWPGLPGSAGARVAVKRLPTGATGEIVGTSDPILRGFTAEVPLRRALAERFNARCLVLFGLADPETADFVTCAEHGEGLSALTCRHLLEASQTTEAVILYGLDGDYPDLLCRPCFDAFAGGDASVTVTTCSRCQRRSATRHHITHATWYGAHGST